MSLPFFLFSGESLPGDEEFLDPPKPLTRDEWMTELPPERKVTYKMEYLGLVLIHKSIS